MTIRSNRKDVSENSKLNKKESQTSTQLEEVVHDVSNSNLNDQCITNNHLELNFESQQEFGFGDGKELNITTYASDPINLVVDVIVDLKVDLTLTTNLQLKPILSEGVNEPTYLLFVDEEMPTEQINKFISFSFDDDGKTRVDRSSRDTKLKILW
ncbi:hypothetical protein PVK06_044387 [Gossypium arboreum]|uniref:Uncharacterized protein n=1 Tax=Gossypium arboreum TaxID=29729 RepID=A0ABR0MR18_GOSAR|nr:hypothetical protein PVK06_044387 [Gossypium arboreum]